MVSKYSYDTRSYPFRELFCQLQRQWDLENVHKLGGFESVGNIPGKDNNSSWHDRFYASMRGSAFIDCYDEFMTIVIRTLCNEPIVCQRYPTLRYQIPHGKGVAAYHVDSDYNHPLEELNIWLPFTNAEGTRSIWIESEPGMKDYSPQHVYYGQFIVFEGGKLAHGNEVNTTDQTRVSIDMRVIPLSVWKPRPDLKGLAHGKVRDTEGLDSYYRIIK